MATILVEGPGSPMARPPHRWRSSTFTGVWPSTHVPWQVEEADTDPQDPVDCRQWTQHHLVAADIRMPPAMALTPPQGEFDSDCVDVNVRGPGGVAGGTQGAGGLWEWSTMGPGGIGMGGTLGPGKMDVPWGTTISLVGWTWGMGDHHGHGEAPWGQVGWM